MQITVGINVQPVYQSYPIEEWEITLDPWHRDAFPDEVRDQIPADGSERQEGWLGYDWAGNPIVFVPFGTVIEVRE